MSAPTMRLALAAVAVVALLTAACGSSERKQASSDPTEEAEGDTTDVGGAASCGKGEAAPITETQALRMLRRYGFDMRSEGPVCDAGIAAALRNTPTEGDTGGVLEREGIVFCHVAMKPAADAPKTVVRSETDGADAELRLANITCTILADSPAGEQKIDPLEQAFADLQRAVQP